MELGYLETQGTDIKSMLSKKSDSFEALLGGRIFSKKNTQQSILYLTQALEELHYQIRSTVSHFKKSKLFICN